MESFFHTLKVGLVHQRRGTTREEARRDLFSHIERYYSRARMHSALGYLTPKKAEKRMADTHDRLRGARRCMLVSSRKLRFTDEFKRETVAPWETSGRIQTGMAGELEIMSTMLRR